MGSGAEQVYVVWDLWDGVRSGIADYDGAPHFFEYKFDNDLADFSEVFELRMIDAETLQMALDQWAIYRAWEAQFHSGRVKLETHPGHGGIDQQYDQLEQALKQRISEAPVVAQVGARFQPIERQTDRPYGCLLDMEVMWSEAQICVKSPSPT
ncbi:hypothetical protein TRP8649_00741 [Pelagimonas phthalicica]|uniref:Uncharacterized protein n=1 Tax=Pelagimonas phthalicica TaxID=1037362 RepID=A0A238J9V5_9RHOB|nr:hypothetical protein [Pelagimonas phthalicica]TDS94815.1 hypothetical protein CLV87_1330 [Pelagimonas phthalicica]SMX26656.1 hypothetical protein TRP8649_00741 [Pelagimonas phthalicica]